MMVFLFHFVIIPEKEKTEESSRQEVEWDLLQNKQKMESEEQQNKKNEKDTVLHEIKSLPSPPHPQKKKSLGIVVLTPVGS